jgi:hypothetical protein
MLSGVSCKRLMILTLFSPPFEPANKYHKSLLAVWSGIKISLKAFN